MGERPEEYRFNHLIRWNFGGIFDLLDIEPLCSNARQFFQWACVDRGGGQRFNE